MEKILEQIEEYLDENTHLNITDIIVSYSLSKQIRKSDNFKYSDKYEHNDEELLDKECHLGNIKFPNGKEYRLLCDLTLELDEVNFN